MWTYQAELVDGEGNVVLTTSVPLDHTERSLFVHGYRTSNEPKYLDRTSRDLRASIAQALVASLR